MRFQEFHQIERLFHLEGEVRILPHHVQGRDDDILDPFVPAILGRIHPGDVLMGGLDDMDLPVLEDPPVLPDRCRNPDGGDALSIHEDFQQVRFIHHRSPYEHAVRAARRGPGDGRPVKTESGSADKRPVEYDARQHLQPAFPGLIGQGVGRRGPEDAYFWREKQRFSILTN